MEEREHVCVLMCVCVCDLSHLSYCKSLQQGPSLRKPTTLAPLSRVLCIPDDCLTPPLKTPNTWGTTIISKKATPK